ncbi:hypothetical protein ACIOJE_40575 [Kitasatospora sp. NPDC087861]|uniref:hypothetical protein n=1 Tax=Kitasatospora sp. NPDC087861 TaxID=3364070 RepID=UPI0038241110
MDLGSELTTLASNGASQLINVIASDGWAAVKSVVLGMWRRSHPERAEADLAQARTDLLTAQEEGTAEQLRQVLVVEWQARLSRLLLAHPDLADELRALLEGALAGPEANGTMPAAGSITITSHVTGGGDAYVAGRDLTVNREPRAPRSESR